jgi:hypothetical protein
MKKRRNKIEKIFSKYTNDRSNVYVKSVDLDRAKSMGRMTVYASSDEKLDKFVENYEEDKNFSENIVVLDNPSKVIGYTGWEAEYSFRYDPKGLDEKYNELFPTRLFSLSSSSPSPSRYQNDEKRFVSSGINYKKNICLFLVIFLTVILCFFGFYSIVFVT